jgi:hypothetical protein
MYFHQLKEPRSAVQSRTTSFCHPSAIYLLCLLKHVKNHGKANSANLGFLEELSAYVPALALRKSCFERRLRVTPSLTIFSDIAVLCQRLSALVRADNTSNPLRPQDVATRTRLRHSEVVDWDSHARVHHSILWYVQRCKQCSVPDYRIIMVEHGSASPGKWVL